MTEALIAGGSQAAIEPDTHRCTSLVVRGREVLGADGIRVEFPWLGTVRPARLRFGGRVVDIGGAHGYPFDVRLNASWRLDDEGLRLSVEVVNASATHAPFGLGVLVSLATVAPAVELLVPAEEVWPADGDGPAAPIPPAFDFRRPASVLQPVEARFTRRHFANLQTQLAVLSPEREIWFTTSADFREASVAVAPDGSGVLKSATCVPDAFARHAAGVDTGLRVLAPNETWRGHALLVVR